MDGILWGPLHYIRVSEFEFLAFYEILPFKSLWSLCDEFLQISKYHLSSTYLPLYSFIKQALT